MIENVILEFPNLVSVASPVRADASPPQTSSPNSMAGTRYCSECRTVQDLTEHNFKRKKDGFNATCRKCSEKSRAVDIVEAEKENRDPREVPAPPKDLSKGREQDAEEFLNLPPIDIQDLVTLMGSEEYEDILAITARVDISSLNLGVINEQNYKERSDAIAKYIWENWRYRFVYVKSASFHIVFTPEDSL
jgi:hypothetical protein